MTERMSREERDAQRKRDERESEQRAYMREMMAAMAPVLKTLDQMGVIAGEIERVRPDGSCAIVLIVDESPLAHPDKKKMLERKLPYVTGISALRDYFLKTAVRRKILLPFSFGIQDRAGKTIREDTVQ